jgi:hypothetical protein
MSIVGRIHPAHDQETDTSGSGCAPFERSDGANVLFCLTLAAVNAAVAITPPHAAFPAFRDTLKL